MTAAAEIITESGVEGLTMQAVADRVDCAVGTIYTYFSSKSALLVALQGDAVLTAQDCLARSRAEWDAELDRCNAATDTAALVRLVAFCHFFAAGPHLYPREFELLQALLSQREREESPEDAATVLPHTLALISDIAAMIDDACSCGALDPVSGDAPLGDRVVVRTVRLAGALNGTMLVSNASAAGTPLGDQVLDGHRLTLDLGRDLLLAWGASRPALEEAETIVARLARNGQLLRGPTDSPGFGEIAAPLGTAQPI